MRQQLKASSTATARGHTGLARLLRRATRRLEPPQRSTILIAAALSLTTALWTAGHFDHITAPGFWPWRALSQLTILWSITLMAIAMLAVVRASALDVLASILRGPLELGLGRYRRALLRHLADPLAPGPSRGRHRSASDRSAPEPRATAARTARCP